MRTSGSLKFGTNGTIRGAMKTAPSQEQKKGPYNHWLPSLHWSSIMPQDVNFLLFQARKQEVYSVNFAIDTCVKHTVMVVTGIKYGLERSEGRHKRCPIQRENLSQLTLGEVSKLKKIYSNFILTFTHSIIKKQTNKQTKNTKLPVPDSSEDH